MWVENRNPGPLWQPPSPGGFTADSTALDHQQGPIKQSKNKSCMFLCNFTRLEVPIQQHVADCVLRACGVFVWPDQIEFY